MTKSELEIELKKLRSINSEREAEICELKHYVEKLRVDAQNSQSDIYSVAVKQCGKPHQLIVCIEELSELMKEITKNLRGYNNTSAITEEIADVEITLEQLKLIFSNRSEVDTVKAKKLMRLTDRIKSGASM